MYPRIIKVVLLVICFSAQIVLASENFQFQDVLTTPAIKSPLASKRLFNGITLTGKTLDRCGAIRDDPLFGRFRKKLGFRHRFPVSSDLTAVHFPTPKEGWAVGHDGVVLHTSDAGASWEKQFDSRSVAKVMIEYYKAHPPKGMAGGAEDEAQFQDDVSAFGMPDAQAPNKSFLDVYFENNSSGFIVGSFGLIFHTSDGGKTWEPWFDRREDILKHPHLYAIRSVGGDLFITGEQGLIMKLDRRTMRFRKLVTPYPGTYFGLVGGKGFMMAYGMRGNVYCSKDRGGSWKKIDTDVMTGFMGAAEMPDGRVILVSQEGDVILSRENGMGFDRVKMDHAFPAASVAAQDKDTIVLAGFGGLLVKKVK